jgi:uncharacterized membrane protein
MPGTMPCMDAFTQLFQDHPVVFLHLVTALGALVLGIVMMARRKGTPQHRAMGWTWGVLMATTTVASAFIRDHHMPNLMGFTPIHAFTVFTAVQLPRGILAIRRGEVELHRRTMRGLFFGACVIAGVFTLLPGRFLGRLLWQALSGTAA